MYNPNDMDEYGRRKISEAIDDYRAEQRAENDYLTDYNVTDADMWRYLNDDYLFWGDIEDNWGDEW